MRKEKRISRLASRAGKTIEARHHGRVATHRGPQSHSRMSLCNAIETSFRRQPYPPYLYEGPDAKVMGGDQ
jgi:hypothetical protein